MTHYVALLRGINVGGNNIIKMTDLKRCFEAQGFGDVTTFIQSGNVLFASAPAPAPADPNQGLVSIRDRIEQTLFQQFDYAARIVLRSHIQMQATLSEAPPWFGAEPELYRYDAIFVREPVTPAEALEQLKTRQGVDQVFAGPGVCYFSRLISEASRSYLSRVVGLPVYKHLTIRNWNTTSRLAAMLDARALLPLDCRAAFSP